MREKIKAKEWLYRGLRTFIQAAGGALSANFAFYFSAIDYTSSHAVKGAIFGLVGAILAAGISAVMNYEKETD